MRQQRSRKLVYLGYGPLPDSVQSTGAFALQASDCLPPAIDAGTIVVTELEWLEGSTPAERDGVADRLRGAFAWLVLNRSLSGVECAFAWLEQGASALVSDDELEGALAVLSQRHETQTAGVSVALLGWSPTVDQGLLSGLEHYGIRLYPVSTTEPCAELDQVDLLICLDSHGLNLAKLLLHRSAKRWSVLLPAELITPSTWMPVPVSTVDLSAAHAQIAATIYQSVTSPNQNSDRLASKRMSQLLKAIDEHAIVSVADRSGRITSANERFCQMSGYTEAELIGQNHRLVKSGLHEPNFYRQMWTTIAAGEVWHGTICNRNKQGKLYWVESTIVPFCDEKGQVSEFLSIRTDVTSLKQSEERLRKHEEMLRRCQNFANVGTWDWHIESGELYWSERIPSLYGFVQWGLSPSFDNFMKLIHADDKEMVKKAIADAVDGRSGYEIEHRVMMPDGSERWLLARGRVTCDLDGRADHMLGVVQDIHERKVAELELAASKAKLTDANEMMKLVLDTIPARVFWKDSQFRYMGANKAFSRDADCRDESQLIGMSDDQLPWGRDETASFRHYDQLVMTSKQPSLNYEQQQTVAGGKKAWVRASKVPLMDDSGEVIGLLGVYEDITDVRMAQKQLKESEQRFSFAVEGAGDGIWDWNIATGEMSCSRQYMEMLGYKHFELAHKIETWQKMVHPEDLGRASETLGDYLSGRRSAYSIQLRLRCKDGSYKWVLCRGTTVEKNSSGQPLRMIGIHSDISEQKRAEGDLKLFREMFDASDQCMAIANVEGEILFVNEAYVKTMGYSAEHVVGRNFREFLSECVSAGTEVAETLLKHKQSWSGLTRRRRADGSDFIAANSFGVVKDHDNNVQYAFVIFSDFTKELNRREELARAKDIAEQASKAKSIFLSSMSHELRTPMNAVIGFAQLLECDDDATPDQLDNVEEILKAGRHLLGLINEILDLSKIEAGKVDLVLEPVALEELVDESCALTAPLAAKRAVSFARSELGGLWVQADSTRLKQVLLNLVSNAIKYNRHGGSVTIAAYSTGGDKVRIEVADSGEGIAPEQLEYLFQPFKRLGAKQSEVEGAGIGLTITRQLVNMMGGRIDVETSEGEGSTFWIELPAAIPEDAEGLISDCLPALRPDATENETRVLCIDDNPANLKLLSQILKRRQGIEILTASSGEEGIRIAKSNQPDLILLDINMPVMDGYAVFSALQKIDNLQDVPVIAVTANAMEEDITRGLEAGFTQYLTKPLDMDQTLLAVDRGLMQASGAVLNG